ELKHAAVKIARAELPWRLVAFGFPADPAQLIALRDAVRMLAGELDYASVVLIGAERAGVFLRGASAHPMAADYLNRLDAAFDLAVPDAVRYDDAKRAIG